MDHEAEVIHEQMEGTRASLADKLEKLEEKVMGTIESTTTSVTNTVASVTETVENVKDAVEGTVETVRESVAETVESVKHTFDFPTHVRNHPWLMFGGSMVAGFAAGQVLDYMMPRRGWSAPAAVPSLSTLAAETNGSQQAYRPPEIPPAPPPVRQETGPSWLGSLLGLFAPEVEKLKGLAIGAALGAVRDAVKRSATPELGSQLADMIDGITTKLGGQVVQGPLFESASPQESQGGDARGARASSQL
jgi:ElaB/YqjD/DUF883 family membrane-anchored ribosome-binding protein